AALQVGDERRTVNGGGDHVVAAEDHAPSAVPGLQLERGRRLRDLLHDEGPLETDPAVLDPHAGVPEEVSGPVVEEVHPDLLQDVHGLLVNRVHLVPGEQVVRLEAVLPHPAPTVYPSPLMGEGAGTTKLCGNVGAAHWGARSRLGTPSDLT